MSLRDKITPEYEPLIYYDSKTNKQKTKENAKTKEGRSEGKTLVQNRMDLRYQILR